MKKYIFQLFAFALVLTSCDSYTDIHQDYIEGGEIVYLQKVDSVVANAGYERIQFKLWYNNGDRLSKTVIYYNNYKDSILIDLGGKLNRGKDSLEFIVDLEETNYNFNVINFNSFNQSSLAVSHFASSYGEMYRATLKNRLLKSSTLLTSGDGFKVEWFSPSENYVGMEVEYNGTSGKQIVAVTDESEITISELPTDNKFRYRTFFYPEETAIDSIPCEWSKDIVLQ